MAELLATPLIDQIDAPDPVTAGPGVVVRLLAPSLQCYVTGAGPALAPNAVEGDDPRWLWLAPDRTLFVALAAAEAPQEGFVSDVTDGLAVFEVAGPRTHELLAMGCTLDPASLAPGRCAQTAFAGVRALLHTAPHGGAVHLHVERSLATYLWQWFAQASTAMIGE